MSSQLLFILPIFHLKRQRARVKRKGKRQIDSQIEKKKRNKMERIIVRKRWRFDNLKKTYLGDPWMLNFERADEAHIGTFKHQP